MKKIILIIEDKSEQVALAKKAVADNDCVAIVAQNLTDGRRLLEQMAPNLFGVITDLHYQSMADNDRDADKPNGLVVVALCVEKNIRVAVCSDVDHHYCQYMEIPLRVLATHQNYFYKTIPASVDRKDWQDSLTTLLHL